MESDRKQKTIHSSKFSNNSWLGNMTGKMTPFERFITSSNLEEPDQIPTMPYCTGPFISRFSNLKVSEYYLDAKKKLKAQLAVLKRFPGVMFYNGVWPDEGVVVEASAFGCNVFWSDTNPPWIEQRIVIQPKDMDKLRIPDPHKDGYMPLMLKHLKYMKQNVSEEIKRDYGYIDGVGYSLGPTDIAGLLRGFSDFMADFVLNPELVKELLDFTTEAVIAWLEAQQEIVGEFRWFAIADDYPGLVSREHFQKFCFPYLKRIFNHFCGIRVFHIDSDTNHILDLLPETGANVLFGFSTEVDLAVAKKKIGNRMCLAGNVPPLEVLASKTQHEVEDTCRKLIEIGKPRGYILTSGGTTTADTSPRNIEAMIKAAEKYGRIKTR